MCDSFSHGANDVANSVGPLAAIWYIYRFHRVRQRGGVRGTPHRGGWGVGRGQHRGGGLRQGGGEGRGRSQDGLRALSYWLLQEHSACRVYYRQARYKSQIR
mgnify:CR=1 FL=1